MASPAGPAERLRFGPLEITYDRRVLAPRPWTLEQATWAASLPAGPMLELGCGAGQIGLAAAVSNGAELLQVDANPAACELAASNAAAAGVADRVVQRCGDVSTVLRADERFAIVIADPPYVARTAVADLPGDPEEAIDGGRDGLELARTFVTTAAAHLAEGGSVVLQLGGPAQADAVRRWLGERGAPPLVEVDRRIVGEDRAIVLLRHRPPTGP